MKNLTNRVESLEKLYKHLERDIFENLEIICKGNSSHTGEDVDIRLNGKSILPYLACSYLEWEINGNDIGTIKIIYASRDKNGKLIVENDMILEEDIIINYPIKKIDLNFKNINITSNNIGRDTLIKFGEDLNQIDLHISSLKVYIGTASEVNKVEMIFI